MGLSSAVARNGTVSIAYATNFSLSNTQDASRFHLHFYTADPKGQNTTVPDDSVMQATANHQGSWFSIYDTNVKVLDSTTERGGRKMPLDTANNALLCVRVVTGVHMLAKDRSGHLATGNCVDIAK